jgi:hypothetical protein
MLHGQLRGSAHLFNEVESRAVCGIGPGVAWLFACRAQINRCGVQIAPRAVQGEYVGENVRWLS